MENFEIKDENKRDMQVGIYMQMLAQDATHAGDSKAWLNGVQKGIQGVEDMLAETSTINVLRRRTLDEFLKGALPWRLLATRLSAIDRTRLGRKGGPIALSPPTA